MDLPESLKCNFFFRTKLRCTKKVHINGQLTGKYGQLTGKYVQLTGKYGQLTGKYGQLKCKCQLDTN